MEPTSPQPRRGRTSPAATTPADFSAVDNLDATSATAASSSAEASFSTTAAHATGDNPYPADGPATPQPAASGVQGTLNNALESGKKWISDSGLAEQAQQLPKAAKDLGNKAWTSINGLSTTQKAVGVGLLAAGVLFLATRGKGKKEDAEYRDKPRKSPFSDSKKYGYGDGRPVDRPGQRPWGSSRYGTAASSAAGGAARISSGSGYSSAASSGRAADRTTPGAASSDFSTGQRRDQGPSSGSKYDSTTSGSQNPNNVDKQNPAY